MSITLRIVVAAVCLFFIVLVARQVARERLSLKYSLLWIALSVLALVSALFPKLSFLLSATLGFKEPSNFIFFVVAFFLIIICFSLGAAVSQLSQKLNTLIQANALQAKRLAELENSIKSGVPESLEGEQKEPNG
jgi:hypothetical protein